MYTVEAELFFLIVVCLISLFLVKLQNVTVSLLGPKKIIKFGFSFASIVDA